MKLPVRLGCQHFQIGVLVVRLVAVSVVDMFVDSWMPPK
jgi:hypothetical protein